ncbi:MAG: 2-amino-4-hydroxy-6-hydroxymethyldihydropteridine diphosphokinase [Erythrobacter sp.]|jgi:2-amino-4-hydroxy-6-hydroxymethyldihydropteridine diphosphokinase|uniref:2-amino-4-hydroxy-6- hydroxymethyldihydropteridine diphosphokinase n=1 Tax=Qipengyuania citrea TaxID=225971 RepID=UPI00209FC385|nr:2-amino-4-hydroxy-6-hydroxymethyldihydropteridine diphosphokinase [Qipengyuania citrea]MCP2018642.1 2-amino-4-hydroxy-6-hydroxymethyldihydropteridine diphosphokinase [Qipengyuania citrea]MDE0902593.1 2-amino-4-hydroxy-6-hydroxymethyldihydropteridine diphosphokinase [Erythrobacter sp.]
MGEASEHQYLVALGSNCRVSGVGAPRAVLAAAVAALAESGWGVEAVARVIDSAPVGPSLRRYANGAAIITGDLAPPDALENLQDIERAFGRNRRGQRWRSRTLDLDIVLWSGGAWHTGELAIPHPLFRQRAFVLRPAAEIAPHWHDPVTHLTVRQLAAGLS